MAVIKRIIPFGIWPFTWGMKGKTRLRARAEYHLDGYDLEICLNEINIDDNDEREFADLKTKFKYDRIPESQYEIALAEREGDETKVLELKFKYGLISEKDHDYGVAEIRADDATWLGVRHKHGELGDNEFLKKMATLRGEPFVNMVSMDVDAESSTLGSFEMDWNDKFIELIQEEGYIAKTDEGCVDLWFTDISKNIALAELHGTGVFDEEAEESYELKKTRLRGGKTEYK